MLGLPAYSQPPPSHHNVYAAFDYGQSVYFETRLSRDTPLQLIVEVANTADLKNLCEVSQCVSKFVIPHLYKSITLNTGDGSLKDLKWRLHRLPFEKVKKYTRHVWIKTPFHKVLRKRCLHQNVTIRQLLGRLEHSDDDDMEDEDARGGIENNDNGDMEDKDVIGRIHRRPAIARKHILTGIRSMILVQILTSRLV